MDITTQCALALQFAENADQIKDVEKYLLFLEQCVITVFKGQRIVSETPSLSTTTKSKESNDRLRFQKESLDRLASKEEEKLVLVKAIKELHAKGHSHLVFFQSTKYHHHAALLIHELLQSLSGNSKEWFRELQVASLQAIQAIVEVLGVEVVRSCLPGVVSSAVRYMQRAHRGKDGSIVCLSAIDLLTLCLKRCFLEDPPEEWIRATAIQLSRTLQAAMSADAFVRSHYDPRALKKCRVLLTEMLGAPILSPERDSALFRMLLEGFLVVDNICHINYLGVAQELPDADEIHKDGTPQPSTSFSKCSSLKSESNATEQLSQIRERNTEESNSVLTTTTLSACFQNRIVQRYIADILRELRGVALLHASTTVLRLPFLRVILLRCGIEEDQYSLFSGMVRKCIRLITLEFRPEELYTYRFPRSHPTGVVDEFIETLSHALAGTPFTDVEDERETDLDNSENRSGESRKDFLVDEDGCTAGERLTNMLLEEAQEVLQDWDLYMLHPGTVYFIGRVITWQFKPVPSYLQHHFFSIEECAYPYPSDFIECTVLEQLWSVIGLPHLWNIEEDENLCSVQQTYHRRLMAATIIRVLDLVAFDVMQAATRIQGDSSAQEVGRRGFDHFCALTLYPIMEKVAVAGFVHETALHCLDSYRVASGEVTSFVFFARVSDYIVDEASRAIKRSYLREKAISVLAGSLRFVVHLLSTEGKPSYQMRSSSLIEEKENEGASKAESIFQDLPRAEKTEKKLPSCTAVPSWWFSFSSSIPLTQVVKRRLSTSSMRLLTQRRNFFRSVNGENRSENEVKMSKEEDHSVSSADVARDAYFISVCANFITVLVQIVSAALIDTQTEGTTEEVAEVQVAGVKGLLLLLCDAIDVAALMNFFTCQEVFPDESDRLTTSANERVQQLQGVVLHAIKVVQTHALGGVLPHGAVHTAVGVIIRGLTSLLTTTVATDKVVRQMLSYSKRSILPLQSVEENSPEDTQGAQAVEVEDHQSKVEKEEDAEEDGATHSWFCSSQSLAVPWFPALPDDDSNTNEPKGFDFHSIKICLPHNLLPLVYQTYLPLVTLLQEPISRFVTTASKLGSRSRIEQRALKEVHVTSALPAGLTGLHALLLLAHEFLHHRYVTDVLPVVMVWYERCLLPATSTPSETRAKQQILDFVKVVKDTCTSPVTAEKEHSADGDRLREQVEALIDAVEANVKQFHRIREARSVIAPIAEQEVPLSTLHLTSPVTVMRDNADGKQVLLTRDDLYIVNDEHH